MDGALRVGGFIFPLSGVKYPDGSIQTTAAPVTSSGHFVAEPIWGWPSLSLPAFGSEVWGWQDGSAILRATYPALLTALTVSQSGVRTNTSAIITGLASTAGLAVGMKVEGAGIPANTTITSIDSLSQIHISNNATSGGTASVIVFPYGNGDGSTTFNLPDARGRTVVGLALSGGHIDVAGIANNEGIIAINRRMRHRHTNGTTLSGSVSDGIVINDGISVGDNISDTVPVTFNSFVGDGGFLMAGSNNGSVGAYPTSKSGGASRSGSVSRSGAVTNGSLAVSGLIGVSASDSLDSAPYLVLGAPIRMA